MSSIENRNIKRNIRAISPALKRFAIAAKTLDEDELKHAGSPSIRYKRPPGLIYFIRAKDAIKIGFTMNVTKRLAELQSANHEDLELLAAFGGGVADEQYIHQIFSALRLRGEWFRSDPAITDYIEWRMGRKRMRGRPPTSRPQEPEVRP